MFALDFAIAATFIALVVPEIKHLSTLVCVVVSAFFALVFSLFDVAFGLVAAAILGMLAGFFVQKLRSK